MSCKSLLYMVGMFVFVPAWIGLLWTDFLKIRERASQLLHAWVLGFATMLATAQLVLVPFVMPLTDAGTSDVSHHSAVSCGAVVCHPGWYAGRRPRRRSRTQLCGRRTAQACEKKCMGKPERGRLSLGFLRRF